MATWSSGKAWEFGEEVRSSSPCNYNIYLKVFDWALGLGALGLFVSSNSTHFMLVLVLIHVVTFTNIKSIDNWGYTSSYLM